METLSTNGYDFDPKNKNTNTKNKQTKQKQKQKENTLSCPEYFDDPGELICGRPARSLHRELPPPEGVLKSP